MSTPRTDAAYIECVRDSIEGVYFDDGRFRKFARRLETELTAALAAKEKAEQERDEARKALTQIENLLCGSIGHLSSRAWRIAAAARKDAP